MVKTSHSRYIRLLNVLLFSGLGCFSYLLLALYSDLPKRDDLDFSSLSFMIGVMLVFNAMGFCLILIDSWLKRGFLFFVERRSKVLCPILFLTARVDEDDKINGLLSGGDDYITKPFSLRELEARIVTNIKREERHQQKTEYRFMDEMLIDYSEKIVAIAGHRMEFTKIEYQIIEFLSMHPGQVFDKERIYAQVCGYDAEGDSRTITELVRRIRKKIADYSEKEYIETVWGIGYRWKK